MLEIGYSEPLRGNVRAVKLTVMKIGKSGFSLLELLMVLGVMGLLMGMLMPAVGVVREKAQRMAAGNHVRQLALAVASYQSVTGRSLVAADLGSWMGRLAGATGIREADLYIYGSDPLLAAIAEEPPPVLVRRQADGSWGPVAGFEEWPIGVVVASGVSLEASPSLTPVVWTRGLGADGRWSGEAGERMGIFGPEGGLVGFLDGRVEFYEDLNADGGQLVNAVTGERTGNIAEALPPGAVAYDHAGRVF